MRSDKIPFCLTICCRLSKLLKEETEIHDLKSLMIAVAEKARSVLFKAKVSSLSFVFSVVLLRSRQ